MDAPDTRVGTTIGKYQIHELIGRGGMGVVYRAEHVYIGKEVAVKVLHHTFGTRDDAVKRFLREARAASLINHPNIVDVTDFGKTNDGTVFFVMELLRGCALDALLTRERRLDLLRAISIMNQLAGALGAAHAKGIVHRDLKPENTMLIKRAGRRELLRDVYDPDGALRTVSEREGDYDFVKILDFGVAKVMEPDSNIKATQSGMVFGTPEYMAPETARVGTSDPRSDVYSLGIIFYEMLTGAVPFTGESPIDVMLQHVSATPIPPRTRAPDAEITETAERVIMKMIAKEPDDRYQTMEEVYRDLQSCYGSVRYRRHAPTERGGSPIPLTRVIKRPASPSTQLDPMTQQLSADQVQQQPASMMVAGGRRTPVGPQVASPSATTATGGRAAREPIPLTKKKAHVGVSTAAKVVPTGASPGTGRATPAGQTAQPPRKGGHPLPPDWDSVPPTPGPIVTSRAAGVVMDRPPDYDSAPVTPPPVLKTEATPPSPPTPKTRRRVTLPLGVAPSSTPSTTSLPDVPTFIPDSRERDRG